MPETPEPSHGNEAGTAGETIQVVRRDATEHEHETNPKEHGA